MAKHRTGDRVKRNQLYLNDSEGDLPSIALATALIDVEQQGKTYQLRAFFDLGAQRSLISEKAVKRLGLPIAGSVDMRIAGINSVGPKKRYGVTNLKVRMGGICSRVPCLVLNTVVREICTPGLAAAAEFLRSQGIKLADVYEGDTIRDVDVLIGADAYCSFVQGHRLANRNINLLRTPSGHMIAG
ncbi:MAG: aspartyl protease family protein, partial [Bacteroidota bacterium]